MEERKQPVPVWQKVLLTVDEAAGYTGIGRDKLYELSEGEAAECVIWIGRKRMFKRKKLEDFLEKNNSL